MKALVVCLGAVGGVLPGEPAVRAVATRAAPVTLPCRPEGAPAARPLPPVDSVLPWDDSGPPTAGTTSEPVIRAVREPIGEGVR